MCLDATLQGLIASPDCAPRKSFLRDSRFQAKSRSAVYAEKCQYRKFQLAETLALFPTP